MNKVLTRLLGWVRDPFGKKRIVQKHDVIISQMRETTQRASIALDRQERFPIGAMVGNRELRERRNEQHV